MIKFGIRFQARRKDEQKAGRCFRRVEEEAGAFMRKWHAEGTFRVAERHAKAVAAPHRWHLYPAGRMGGGGGVGWREGGASFPRY